MTSYRISPAAESDLIEIAAYIEADIPAAAAKLVADLYHAFGRLADRPAIGHRRPDLTPLPVLFWPVRRAYLIIFRQSAVSIEVIRVINAKRDIAAILAR